jgi:hypothetical protein
VQKPEWKKQFGNTVCIHEGNTKTDLNEIECGLDVSGSTWKPVVDSCKNVNKLDEYIKYRIFLVI